VKNWLHGIGLAGRIMKIDTRADTMKKESLKLPHIARYCALKNKKPT